MKLPKQANCVVILVEFQFQLRWDLSIGTISFVEFYFVK